MKATDLKTLVAHYIEERRLLDKSRLQLVALSGGADSVALLMLLRDLGYRLEAVHCNFQLRGDEADRDEDFCQSLCDELAIPLHRAHFDTRAYAQLHGISIEMAARQLRYAYFRQLREAIGAEAICVAHHRDDSVETILLNLIRGTGIHGLTGMKPRQGDVVRPLLCVSRADLVSYLDGLGRSYVTDSSNLVADVKRNKVRLQILPMIEAINPSFRDTVLTMAAELEGIEQVVDTQLAHYAEATELSIEAIQQEPSAELALYYFLQPRHFNPSQIRQIADRLAASSGSRWISPTHELLSDRGRLTIHPLEADAPRPMRIPETGRYSYANEDDQALAGREGRPLRSSHLARDRSAGRRQGEVSLDHTPHATGRPLRPARHEGRQTGQRLPYRPEEERVGEAPSGRGLRRGKPDTMDRRQQDRPPGAHHRLHPSHPPDRKTQLKSKTKDMDKQSLYTLMEDHGIRPTANRVLIASALLKGDGPKTMKELETALLSIDKSVISRTMALFRSHHLVHVIEGGTGVASYELCLSHDDDHDEDVHVHFFCEQCLRTICLNHVPTPSVAVPEGFLTRSESHLVRGICPNCARKMGLTR